MERRGHDVWIQLQATMNERIALETIDLHVDVFEEFQLIRHQLGHYHLHIRFAVGLQALLDRLT